MENYVIQCSAECADDCRAHERGVHEVTDDEMDVYLVATHDSPPVEDPDTGRDFYGAWWQVFEKLTG